MKQVTYLGDGVYCEFQGFDFKLYTPRENGVHEIYLEPEHIELLKEFKDKLFSGSKE